MVVCGLKKGRISNSVVIQDLIHLSISTRIMHLI